MYIHHTENVKFGLKFDISDYTMPKLGFINKHCVLDSQLRPQQKKRHIQNCSALDVHANNTKKREHKSESIKAKLKAKINITPGSAFEIHDIRLVIFSEGQKRICNLLLFRFILLFIE